MLEWPVLEQVLLAAIDLHDASLIKECLQKLDQEFPGSLRVGRLKKMARLELRERYDEALAAYDELIKKDEANSLYYKRKIAILISQKKISDAIKEMCEYLKKFMNDHEAWLELADLYIQEQEYAKAAFCYEELIITNPHNHLYHERYAEILYTMGTLESLELSRGYFAQALKLHSSNMRALFGLYLSANQLCQHPKSTSQKKKENAKIASYALNLINKKYKDANNEMVSSLDSLFSQLSIN